MLKFLGQFIINLLILSLVILIFGYPFMLLWNWIAPIYWVNAPTLTFWQAVGSLLLLDILAMPKFRASIKV